MKRAKNIVVTCIAVFCALSISACGLFGDGEDNELPITYTVTFDGNGGSGVSQMTGVESGSKISKPTPDPTYFGHIFYGWFKESALIRPWDWDTDTVTADITLYAKWATEEQSKAAFAVTFNTMGGGNIAAATVMFNNLLQEPATPNKSGYIFDGWYTESGYVNKWNFATDKVEQNFTLYAKWKAVVNPTNYLIIFESNGGSDIESIPTDGKSAIELPDNPDKAGYTFDGWYFDQGVWANPLTENALLTAPISANTTVFAKWNENVANGYQAGDGTERNPYVIASKTQLAYFRDQVNNGNTYFDRHFTLSSTIDLDGAAWMPIGTIDKKFSGMFDGESHTVRNFTIISSAISYVGLFANNDGCIENLGVENFEIDVVATYVGGLVGYNSGTITNCHTDGEILTSASRASYTGGLVGSNSGTVTLSHAGGTVTTSSAANSASATTGGGGVAGNNSGIMINCYATGNVAASASASLNVNAGGLAGNNSGTIINCYGTGDVTAINSYASSNSVARAGGLAGYNSYTITGSYAVGDITATVDSSANAYAGGLVGYNNYSDSITKSFRYAGQSITRTCISTIYTNATNALGTQTTTSNLQSEDWVKLNLWTEWQAWQFSNEGFPTLNYEYINTTVLLSTKEDLISLQGKTTVLKYKLTADIDLDDTEWTPIGLDGNTFAGVFDGDGYKIHHFKLVSWNEVGLFGNNCGVIKNLNIDSLAIDISVSVKAYVGALVGWNKGGTIKNCHVTNSEREASSSNYDVYIGGLVGRNSDGTIKNCSVTGGATSSFSNGSYIYIGGLVGDDAGGSIIDCYATGNVAVSDSGSASIISVYAGGLVGSVSSAGALINCYATGNVNATSSGAVLYAGGLVGSAGTITNCYATGDVTATASISAPRAGGLAGRNHGGTITSSYAVGHVTANCTSTTIFAFAGGLVGENEEYSKIINGYATGNVILNAPNKRSGGLVGYNNGTITNCYRYAAQTITTGPASNTLAVAIDAIAFTSSDFYIDTLKWSVEDWDVSIPLSYDSGPTLK